MKTAPRLAILLFAASIVCGTARGQVERLIPVVTQVTGATLYRTSVTISNASDTASTPVRLDFAYRSPVDGTFQVAPVNISAPLGPHQMGFIVDVVQALKDAGAIRAADLSAPLFGTLKVTFSGISNFDKSHTAAVARTYSAAAGGGTNGIAYQGRCECEIGSRGRVEGGSRSGAFLTDGETRANLGIFNDGPGPTDVTVTYFNGGTGQQLKQFLLSSVAGHVLEDHEVYQLNNIFADPAIPANVHGLVVRTEAVADEPYIAGYVVQLDNTSQDGSFFLLEEE